MWNIRIYLGISTEVRDDGDLDWDDGRGERGVGWFWKDGDRAPGEFIAAEERGLSMCFMSMSGRQT